jgi:hypothetical protein
VGETHARLSRQRAEVYEALSYVPPDDYDEWFNAAMPNLDPLAACGMHWNDWKACPYYYEEFVHPTAWTTTLARP